MEVKVYRSSNKYSLIQVLKDSFKGYKNSFYLAKQLAKRDLSALYRQSLLGFLWAFIPIIMNAAVWIFLQSTGTVKLSETAVPYALYVVIGTTIWSIFSDSFTMLLNDLTVNKAVITKINFDKEALILLGFFKLLFNSGIKMLLIIFLLIYFKISLSFSIVYFLPLLVLSMLLFVSLGMLLVPVGMLYQDIGKGIPLLMQLLMYLTPVVYNIPKEGLMKNIMECNPFTYLLVEIRNTLTGLQVENFAVIGLISISTLLLFTFASIIYRVSMPIITERMSA